MNSLTLYICSITISQWWGEGQLGKQLQMFLREVIVKKNQLRNVALSKLYYVCKKIKTERAGPVSSQPLEKGNLTILNSQFTKFNLMSPNTPESSELQKAYILLVSSLTSLVLASLQSLFSPISTNVWIELPHNSMNIFLICTSICESGRFQSKAGHNRQDHRVQWTVYILLVCFFREFNTSSLGSKMTSITFLVNFNIHKGYAYFSRF